jgi:hypothetical protein
MSFKNKKMIPYLIIGFLFSFPALATSEYRLLTDTKFFDFIPNIVIDPGYVENNHPCVEQNINTVCNHEGTDLLVVNRLDLMKVLDGNVSGNLYFYDGREWDVNQVYTGKIVDFSQRNSGNSCSINSGSISSIILPFVPEGFDSDISMWDMGSARDMSRMFACNTTFNQPLNNWVVSNVKDFNAMFGISAYNHPLNSWDMRNAERIQSMFQGSDFNSNISIWEFRDLVMASRLFFENTSFNKPINFDLTNIQNGLSLSSFLSGATAFNSVINIDLSKVSKTSNMFMNAISFNQPVNNFDMSNVTDLDKMFMGATSFNQDLNDWIFSSDLDSINDIFNGASSFNGDITTWDVKNIRYHKRAWANTNIFNRDLSDWCVTSVQIVQDIEDYDLNADSWDESKKPIWSTCP